MRALVCLVCFCVVVSSLCAQTEYQTGRVHDSIPVNGISNETFALYLPTTFSRETPSSIVFIFEPAARGAIGIQPFIPSAEHYGHILVCSNNSRNGPYERNFDIANNLFGHIFSHFDILENQMYAAGFSGGSRLATAIASLTNKFAGVVGCGAGFSGVQEHMPGVHDYAYVGLCGDRDMNYKEMVENKGYFNLIKFNSTLISFDGEHRWPPENQILRAFDWLYLQSLKKRNPLPNQRIQELYEKDLDFLKQLQEVNNVIFEAEQVERMLKSYSGVLETNSLAKQYAVLRKSKRLKSELNALESALQQERKWVEKLNARLNKDLAAPKETNWNWWSKELEKLAKLEHKDDAQLQKMVFRIRFDLFARVYSRKNALLHQQSNEQTIFVDEFLELLHSKSE